MILVPKRFKEVLTISIYFWGVKIFGGKLIKSLVKKILFNSAIDFSNNFLLTRLLISFKHRFCVGLLFLGLVISNL